MRCDSTTPSSFVSASYPFKYVYAFRINFRSFKIVSKLFPNAVHITLENNTIDNICSLPFPHMLIFLQITFSKLQGLKHCCIEDKSSLVSTILSDNNQLNFLHSCAFVNLPNLRLIDLSRNSLTILPNQMVKNSPNLEILKLNQTSIAFIHPKAFQTYFIGTIHTTNFHVCCLASPDTLCFAAAPWYTSCTALLPSEGVRIVFGVMSFFVFTLNLASFSIYLKSARMLKPYSVTVLVMNIGDALCSLYLLVLWGADLHFRHYFLSYEQVWKSSFTCFLACFFVVWFTVLSQMALLFLSVSRYISIVHPYMHKMIPTLSEGKLTLRFLGLMMLLSFVLSVGSSFLIHLSLTALPMRMCLPFIDPSNSSSVVTTITWAVACTQILISTLISIQI